MRSKSLIFSATLLGCSPASDLVDGFGEPLYELPALHHNQPLPGPITAVLEVKPLYPGMLATLVASDISPGQTVHFFVGLSAGYGPCLGNACLDLSLPVYRIGEAIAHGNGEATLQFMLPYGLTPGLPLFFQGLVPAGANTYLTNVDSETVTYPCIDDAFEDDDTELTATDLYVGISPSKTPNPVPEIE